MAGRLRPVVLAAAVVIGLLAAFPHLGVTSSAPTHAAVQPVRAPGDGLGNCAPGAQRCDPSSPSSTVASSLWTGVAILAAFLPIGALARRIRRGQSNQRLATGVSVGIDRPPQLLAIDH